jgi:hypothetical protein
VNSLDFAGYPIRASAFPFAPYSLFYENGTAQPGGYEYDIVAVSYIDPVGLK